MSSELIEGLLDDKGTELGLEMNARGHAYLTLYGATVQGHDDLDIVTLHLPPMPEGRARAEVIECALRAWREHTTTEEVV